MLLSDKLATVEMRLSCQVNRPTCGDGAQPAAGVLRNEDGREKPSLTVAAAEVRGDGGREEAQR